MKLAIKALFAFLLSLSFYMHAANLRTIVNTSDKEETFYAADTAYDARLVKPKGALFSRTIVARKSGTIDIGDNSGCVYISVDKGRPKGVVVASERLCDGGQLCWDGDRFGWQAWGLSCNGVNPRIDYQQ